MSYLKFRTVLNHDPNSEKKTVLDYDLQVEKLKEEDSQWHWEGTNKNYSLGGFEMKFQRHTTKYIVEYYFPSGLLVATSWVRVHKMLYFYSLVELVFKPLEISKKYFHAFIFFIAG